MNNIQLESFGNNKEGIKISVITATFNSVLTIDDCLSSLAQQSYKNYEHIVIDGGSNDGTLDILRRRKSTLAKLISEPDKGIYDALNKGIEHATGDVIGFLHSDDMYGDSSILEHIANAFTDPSIIAVYGDLDYVRRRSFDKVVRRWKSSEFSIEDLRRGWMPPHPTLYVKTSWYKKNGGFDIKYKISADYSSILKMFNEKNFKSKYIPMVFIKMRLGGISNRSFRNILLKSSEDLDALKSTGVGGRGTFFYKNFRKIIQFL